MATKMAEMIMAANRNSDSKRRSRRLQRALTFAVAAAIPACERMMTVCAEASNVTFTLNDAAGSDSFGAEGHWSNSAAPSSSNTYEDLGVSSAGFLRAYGVGGGTDVTGSATFAGASLQLDDGAILYLKTTGTITVNNLIMNGGEVLEGAPETSAIATLAGNITFNSATTSYMTGQNGVLAISSAVMGSGSVVFGGSDAAGNNTFNADQSSSAGAEYGQAITLSGNWSGYSGTATIANTGTVSIPGGVTIGATNGTSGNAAYIIDSNSGNDLVLGSGISSSYTANIGSLATGPGSGASTAIYTSSSFAGTVLTLAIGNLNTNTTFAGIIKQSGGTMAVDKVGSGTLTLSGSNLYSAGTTISAGTLQAANASALGTGPVDVKATIAVGADSTHPGLLNINNSSQASTWEAGANYAWKTDSATGTAGTNFDQINMTSLNVTASNSSPFTIILSDLSAAGGTIGTAPSGLAAGDSWILATTSTTAQINGTNVTSGALLTSGLSSDVFALNTSNFDNASGQVPPSAFSLDFVTSGGGDNLVLTYNGTPEPCTTMLVLAGALPMLTGRRRRRRNVN